MTMTLRALIVVSLSFVTGLVGLSAHAQTNYPTKPVTIIVPYGPGSGNDMISREIGQRLNEQLGVSFVIENKVGATGNIAMDYTAQAKPDGYTMILTSTSSIIYQVSNTIRTNMSKDFTPIAFVAGLPYVLSVPPSVPAKTLKELAALAKAKPGEMNYNGPAGSMSAFLGSLFKSGAGVDMVMVPYKATSDAQVDVLAGRIQLWITTSASALPLVKGGKVTALAVTGEKRLNALPDVPTAIEAGFPTMTPDISFFLLGPAGIPADIVAKLNANVNTALKTQLMQDRLASFATATKMGSPDDVKNHIATETERWQAAVKNEVLSK
jgi:tripartite-type tricarboxylate transporter receptor subunit TctC